MQDKTREIDCNFGSWRTEKHIQYWLRRRCSSGFRRLAAVVQIVHAELTKDAILAEEADKQNGSTAPANTDWIRPSLELLDCADDALRRGELDAGWSFLWEAERTAIDRFNQGSFEVEVSATLSEARNKLGGWRKETVEAAIGLDRNLYGSSPSDVGRLREAMRILHGHHGNTHAKRADMEFQIRALAIITFVVVVILLFLLPSLDPAIGAQAGAATGDVVGDAAVPDRLLSVPRSLLSAIVLFGVMGACLTGTRSIIARGLKGRRPERSITMWVTLTRPVIGAAAAMATFAVLSAGLLGLSGPSTVWTVLSVAFASGFSEQLVVNAVDKVVPKAEKQD